MSVITGTKLELAAAVEDVLQSVPGEGTAEVLTYEAKGVADGRITATITAGPVSPEWLTFVTRIYCPMSDAAKGTQRIEAAVEALLDDLPSPWPDPSATFGWDDRLSLFIGQVTITIPRTF